jgi:lipid-binding SYLF domain-containing protein
MERDVRECAILAPHPARMTRAGNREIKMRVVSTPFLAAFCCAVALIMAAPGARAEEEKTLTKTAAEIEAGVNAALKSLYASEPEAKALANKAVAVLVFPEILKAGVIVGGQYGEGALRQGGKTTGYYSIASASIGLQFGAQTYGYVMYFLNQAALDYSRNNDGWEIGSGPTLVGGDKGWSSSMGTNDLQGDIAVVFFNQNGVMAGAGIQGSKISKIER